MMACYRLDPDPSRFTVQAFASGMLSFLGHSPTFAVRDYDGEIRLDAQALADMWLQVSVRADSLKLLNQVRPADRADIEGRMRQEVLETAAYPEIQFESGSVTGSQTGQGQYQLRIGGRLALHGVTHPHEVDARLLVYDDGIRLIGETGLQLSDYRIRPVTALGGSIKLKDQLRLTFDLAAWKEDTEPEES
jgi:polyisoprenoid-binding protein YceI